MSTLVWVKGLGMVWPSGTSRRPAKHRGTGTHVQVGGRRRLSVCARDVYRLVDRFRGTAVPKMEEYGLLERLLHEQLTCPPKTGPVIDS